MAAAGFPVIRVGESVWSTWEPRDGGSSWTGWSRSWMRHTPRHRGDPGHPDLRRPAVAAPALPRDRGRDGDRHRVGWGARQEIDCTHPAYRFHAERVIRAVVGRYREHPAIIGCQVDNEPGLELLYNTTCSSGSRTGCAAGTATSTR